MESAAQFGSANKGLRVGARLLAAGGQHGFVARAFAFTEDHAPHGVDDGVEEIEDLACREQNAEG